MRILVTAASRHGSTAEIATRIGETLAIHSGLDVRVRAPHDVEDITGYGAYVLGSAIYKGHWLEAARDLVQGHDGRRRLRDYLTEAGYLSIMGGTR